MKTNEPKVIQVYESEGEKVIGMCSVTKAELMVSIKRARWITEGSSICVLQSRQELKEESKQIIEREGRKCYICGTIIPESEKATIDHVIPRKSRHYLAYEENNKRCCCQRCNLDKGSMTLSAYISHIENNKNKYQYLSKTRLKKLKQYANQHERAYMFDELKKMGIYRRRENVEEND